MKNGFVLVKVEMTTCLSNQHLTTVLGILWKTLHLQKKAALSMLLEMVYSIPDDSWDAIVRQFEELKKEG